MKRLLLIALLTCSCSTRQAKLDANKDTSSTKPQPVAENTIPQMSQEEMMKKAAELSVPGQGHQALAPIVGQWKADVKFWSAPGEKPEVSKGSAKHEWVLGKRFIKEDYRGTFGGKPFQGIGMLGYDNVSKEYVSTWSDTMITDIMTSRGQFDPAEKSLEMTSKFNCPITGQEMEARSVTKIINDNNHVMEMYQRTPDGKEFKSFEIRYTRAGS